MQKHQQAQGDSPDRQACLSRDRIHFFHQLQVVEPSIAILVDLYFSPAFD